MKPSYLISTLFALCASAQFALAGYSTINGSTDPTNPAQFSHPSAWRRTPTFDNQLNAKLGAVAGETAYYNVDGNFTVKQLITESGFEGNF